MSNIIDAVVAKRLTFCIQYVRCWAGFRLDLVIL